MVLPTLTHDFCWLFQIKVEYCFDFYHRVRTVTRDFGFNEVTSKQFLCCCDEIYFFSFMLILNRLCWTYGWFKIWYYSSSPVPNSVLCTANFSIPYLKSHKFKEFDVWIFNFRMSYKDFVSNYQKLEICYLGPDSLALEEEKQGKRKFEGKLFEGSWRPRVNAGGCRNYPGNIYIFKGIYFY